MLKYVEQELWHSFKQGLTAVDVSYEIFGTKMFDVPVLARPSVEDRAIELTAHVESRGKDGVHTGEPGEVHGSDGVLREKVSDIWVPKVVEIVVMHRVNPCET